MILKCVALGGFLISQGKSVPDGRGSSASESAVRWRTAKSHRCFEDERNWRGDGFNVTVLMNRHDSGSRSDRQIGSCIAPCAVFWKSTAVVVVLTSRSSSSGGSTAFVTNIHNRGYFSGFDRINANAS